MPCLGVAAHSGSRKLSFIFGIIWFCCNALCNLDIKTFHVISMAAVCVNLNQNLVKIRVRLFAM